jgi:hypothetical protein
MNRPASSLGALVVAALLSCSETNYYIDLAPSATSGDGTGGMRGEGGALQSDSNEAVDAASASSAGGLGAAGGAGGHNSSSTSAASSSAEAASVASTGASSTSSASSGPDLVDCHGGSDDFAMPCDGGVCSRDSVCRSLARCKVAADDWERVVNCLDPNLRAMTVYIVGPARLTQGCMKEPDGNRHRPLSCPTGDKCVIDLIDWTGLPRPVSNGVCE